MIVVRSRLLICSHGFVAVSGVHVPVRPLGVVYYATCMSLPETLGILYIRPVSVAGNLSRRGCARPGYSYSLRRPSDV